MRLLRAVLAALALLAVAAPAGAEERIAAFGSTIFVKADGTLDVVERIFVDVENVSIRHGIYRDFPTRYSKPGGGRVKIGFRFVEAKLDGQAVEHSLESLTNGVRIKLGSPDSYVPRGRHLYQIRYEVTRQLGFFDTYDELYWNVTGNGWDFPIDQAGAQIHLPKPVRFGQRAVYTGPQGSTGNAAGVVQEQPGQITFMTNAPLGPREGLTVAVAFPKGVVAEPTESQKLGWWITDMLPLAAAVLTVIAVIGFLLFAYFRVGRDPPEGTIVPLFAPPDDLSPAAMRYLVKRQMDNRAFAAALVEAGVKGHVVLGEEDGFLMFGGKKYIEQASGPRAPLPEPEQSAVNSLVATGERLELDNEHHAKFSAAKSQLEKAFKARFENTLFLRNYMWAGAAFVVWLFGAYLTALAMVFDSGMLPWQILLVPPVGLVVAFVIHRLGKSVESSAGTCLLNVIASGAALAAIGFSVMTIIAAIATGRWEPVAIAAVGLPLAFSSLFWIEAPTLAGRKVLDRVAGFKHYLSITERDRLDRMQAPRDTLQMFERWLPYAVALGVENRWADRFSSQLAAAAAAGRQGFAWYHGSHSPWTDTGGFTQSIGSSLASAVSSASTAPGSSSGSGGGGSSGGGGGGGGGGGW